MQVNVVKEQGIELEPQIHLGSISSALERQGIQTDRGNINREIRKRNSFILYAEKKLEWATKELASVKESIKETATDIKSELREMFSKMAEKVGHLSLPVVRGRYLRMIQNRQILQDIDKAVNFANKNGLTDFAGVQTFMDKNAPIFDNKNAMLKSKQNRLYWLNEWLKMYQDYKPCKEVHDQSAALSGFKKRKFDKEREHDLTMYGILRERLFSELPEGEKKLLGNKFILAHILIKTVDELKGMNPKEVVTYIEGEPIISKVPIDPGMTNVSGDKIVGLNTENSEINEGLVRFDIIFYVRMKGGLSQIIINVEAQKDEPAEYDILNRATFYVSRLVSSQKGRDFVKQNYDDIKRVFSIWICMNLSENCMDYLHFSDDKLIGNYQWKGRIDIQNIVLIGLANELPEHDEKYELHRLLGALFSESLSATEKLSIIETEYDIPIEENIRKEVSIMCNLSQGIREAERNDIIMNMHEEGYSFEEVKSVIEKMKMALA